MAFENEQKCAEIGDFEKSKMPTRRREEFEVQLADEDVLKVRFDRILKKVIDFSVQYLAWIEGL